MCEYLVTINCKFDEINRIDNETITTDTPIQDLRKLFPNFVIQRGNSWNWNITLWHSGTNTHLYYVVKPKQKNNI